ncbi:MAG: hypothetical protein V4725_15005, partial [Bacteroidota bacterium]
TNTTNFGSFTTDKQTGEIVLETDIDVDGALALTNGIINAGLNSKIITIGALGSAGVGSNTSHVSGKLAHTFNATAVKNFPVGKEGKWRPVSINLTSLDNPPTVVSVDQVEAMFTGSLPPYTTVPNARYWIISSTGGSGHVYDLTVDGTDYVPGVSAQTVILKDNGATSFYEATFSAPNYTAQNISGFSNFALAWQCNPPTIDAQPVSPAPVCTGERHTPVQCSRVRAGQHRLRLSMATKYYRTRWRLRRYHGRCCIFRNNYQYLNANQPAGRIEWICLPGSDRPSLWHEYNF